MNKRKRIKRNTKEEDPDEILQDAFLLLRTVAAKNLKNVTNHTDIYELGKSCLEHGTHSTETGKALERAKEPMRKASAEFLKRFHDEYWKAVNDLNRFLDLPTCAICYKLNDPSNTLGFIKFSDFGCGCADAMVCRVCFDKLVKPLDANSLSVRCPTCRECFSFYCGRMMQRSNPKKITSSSISPFTLIPEPDSDSD